MNQAMAYALALVCIYAHRLIPDPAAMPATPAARGFVQLLGRDERAYQQLYAATFEALDRTWVEMGASYMRFNEVMGASGYAAVRTTCPADLSWIQSYATPCA
jgi:hypothetical protein